jgi:site-specific recombinase XerD
MRHKRHRKRPLAIFFFKQFFMKKKESPLQSSEYKLLLQSFTEWLQLLNYSPLSVPALARSVHEFLQYQELNNKPSLEQLTATDANDFIELLKTQTGQRSGKPLSNGHINKTIQALLLFSKYIRETKRSIIGFSLQRLEERRSKPVWLTIEEIQLLYDACSSPSGRLGGADDVLGIRDKAMLAVYYGCGLRLNEGACLEVSDIDQGRKVLHVRKGKLYKERFVPVAERSFEEIKLYLDYGRPQLLQSKKHDYFFVDANKGHPMQRQSLYIRIKALVRKAKLKKKIGTHTLRHSIATHLLQSGMKLERIQQFLGHADLDSTQIYTHLVNEEAPNIKWKLKT